MSKLKLAESNVIKDTELTENQRLTMFLRDECIAEILGYENLSKQKRMSIINDLEAVFADANKDSEDDFSINIWTKALELEAKNINEIAEMEKLGIVFRKIVHVMKHFSKGEKNETNHH